MSENNIFSELIAKMLLDDEQLNKATTMQGVLDALQQMQETLYSIASMISGGQLPVDDETASTENWKQAKAQADYIVKNYAAITESVNEFRELKPFIEKIMEQPEYADLSLSQILKGKGGTWQNLLQLAHEMREAATPRVTGKEVKKVDYPIDKVNTKLWDFLVEEKANGQLGWVFDTATDKDRKAQKDISVIVSLNFDELLDDRISKQLTPYDKRVYIAIAALFNAGNEIVTATNIYEAMGGTGKAGANDIEKITQAIIKMNAAHMTYDNRQEQQYYKKMPYLEYHGSLLPMEFIVSYVNGKKTDAAIHIFREPPLVSFARERRQITSFPRKLLCSPLSKTNSHIIIEDALLELSAAAKKGSINTFVSWEKLYERCKITSRMQKSRLPDIVTQYLDHFKSCKHIKNYVIDKRGITFVF